MQSTPIGKEIELLETARTCTVIFDANNFEDLSTWGSCVIELNTMITWYMADGSEYLFNWVP